MCSRFLRILLITTLLLGTTCTTVVQANEGDRVGGSDGYVQSPPETIIQIVVTAICLRILNRFDLP